MSFEEFAKRTAGSPEAVAGAAARAAEIARKPFADAFVADIYPHWQGPLKTISGLPGVESATHGHVNGAFPGIAGPWLITEVLTITTHLGIRAVVAYAFAGEVNDARAVRVAGYIENGPLVLAVEGPAAALSFAPGPLAALVKAVAADVTAGAALFGQMLIDGLDARAARLAKEAADAEAAAKAKEEADAKEKADADRRLKERTEAEAATMLERRAADEAARK